jgi:hypothetical protein
VYADINGLKMFYEIRGTSDPGTVPLVLLLRELTLDPSKDYQPTGRPPGPPPGTPRPPRKRKNPEP